MHAALKQIFVGRIKNRVVIFLCRSQKDGDQF